MSIIKWNELLLLLLKYEYNDSYFLITIYYIKILIQKFIYNKIKQSETYLQTLIVYNHFFVHKDWLILKIIS
jgi:hypothetical protein